jgi:hypothetical protein
MNTQPILYQAFSFRRPVAIRPEINETIPAHADMLRYDRAFHHPDDPSLVVFPIFKVQGGRFPLRITTGRWDSFIIKLEKIYDYNSHRAMGFDPSVGAGIDDLGIHNLSQWIGYEHGANYRGLEKITLGKVLEGKTKIVGWRSL